MFCRPHACVTASHPTGSNHRLLNSCLKAPLNVPTVATPLGSKEVFSRLSSPRTSWMMREPAPHRSLSYTLLLQAAFHTVTKLSCTLATLGPACHILHSHHCLLNAVRCEVLWRHTGWPLKTWTMQTLAYTRVFSSHLSLHSIVQSMYKSWTGRAGRTTS